MKESNNNSNQHNDNFDYIYEMVQSIVSKIILDKTKSDIKLKQYNILEKIISNIILAEKLNKNSEKFRKIRINNPNINLILRIKGVYDFFIFLGFKELNENNDIYLYLPEENISLQKLEKSLNYMNLLNINFIDLTEDFNNYEKPEYESKKSKDNQNLFPKKNIVDNNNINSEIIISNNSDAEKMLKETGKERYNQALKYSEENNLNSNSYFSLSSIFIFITCNKCGNSQKKEAKKFFEQKKLQNPQKNNIMSLSDFDYKNPNLNQNIECNDEIGKKCLELTNKFRAKNNLPSLEWDDSIWVIAYHHSKNMGEGEVPFGHKGFDERVNKFNFRYYKACENVYMCQGISQYYIAENAVKGWINSPGHKQNLLSDTSHCAIATYKNNFGSFYLTQIFVLK